MKTLHEKDLITVISTHTGVNVYLDEVPDTASLPAITVTTVAESPAVMRDTTGKKLGDASENLVALVAGSMSELDTLVKQFVLLDNTSNEYFQRIRVDFRSRDPRESGVNVFRVLYNLTATR